jgi:hypothetical protein
VFDVIRFVCPDYCYPTRKQGKKRKGTTSTTSIDSRSKKVKVLTHRPRRIETTDVPRLSERVAPVTEPSRSMPVEAKSNPTEETKLEKATEPLKVLSPPCATELPKPSNVPAVTPRKRRMASVLDAVMESVKIPPPFSIEASGSKTEDVTEIITTTPAYAEAGPSETAPEGFVKESLPEKSSAPAPEAPSTDDLNFIIQHALGKQLSARQATETEHYAKELMYPHGSLVYGGDNDDDFLYCLPDGKEIDVCREMMDHMGYLKLELGLSVMTKDQLTDSLAYNSLKVCIL